MKNPRLHKIGIILINAAGFQFYNGGNDIQNFPFSQGAVRDLEVINEEELKKQVNSVIEKNKISPLALYIVLTDSVLFQKDFINTPAIKQQGQKTPVTQPTISPEQLLNEIQHYIETIPFENLSTKTFKIENGVRVIGTNRSLYEAIKKPFENIGCVAEAIAPLSIIGKEVAGHDNLDKALISIILKKTNLLRQNALEIHAQLSPNADANEIQAPKKPFDKKRLYLMLGVFGVLLLILAAVSINTFVLSTSPTPNKPAQVQQPILPVQVTPAITPAESSPSAQIDRAISIQILNASGITNQAKDLQNQLTELGFSNTEVGTSRQTNSERTLVIFQAKVPQITRTSIIEELQKTFAQVAAQETSESSFDVIITTGLPKTTPTPQP